MGKASNAFQNWIDQLTEGLKTILVPALVKAEMLDIVSYNKLAKTEPWIPLLEVADFNSLIALSQEHQTPVYALTQAQTKQAGAVWEQTKESMKKYETAFALCAEKVFSLTS